MWIQQQIKWPSIPLFLCINVLSNWISTHMDEPVNLREREWEVTNLPKMQIKQSKRGRHTPAFYNVKDIEQRWCEGKQFQWNNITWAYFFKIWFRDSQFLYRLLWIEDGTIFWAIEEPKSNPSPLVESIPKVRKPKLKSIPLAISIGSPESDVKER